MNSRHLPAAAHGRADTPEGGGPLPEEVAAQVRERVERQIRADREVAADLLKILS